MQDQKEKTLRETMDSIHTASTNTVTTTAPVEPISNVGRSKFTETFIIMAVVVALVLVITLVLNKRKTE